jgi:hypothetical protein
MTPLVSIVVAAPFTEALVTTGLAYLIPVPNIDDCCPPIVTDHFRPPPTPATVLHVMEV